MKDLKELTINNNQPELIFGQELTLANELNHDIRNLDYKVNNLINDFISIGFYLDKIKENKLFNNLGYSDIYDFAYSKYKMSKTSCKNFIAVSNKFRNKSLSYPQLDNKFSDYNFSQLVELVPEDENNLDNFSPEQSVKEIRLTKFSKNLESDHSKLVDWFFKDLYSYLEKEFKNCKFKKYKTNYSCYFTIIYKNKELTISVDSTSKLIELYCYSLKKSFHKETIYSIKLIHNYLCSFISQVDKELEEQEKKTVETVETITKKITEVISSSPISDQTEDDTSCIYENDEEDLVEELSVENEDFGPTSGQEIEVEVVEHVQKLKNNDQRIEYIRNPDNYNVLYELKEVNARILQMKEIPYIYEIQYFGKFYYTDEPTWKHAEYHFLDPHATKDFGYCMFKHTSQSLNVIVEHLKSIKF